MSSINKIYNRPVREIGGGNIYDLVLRSGVEKSFVFFPGHEEHEDSWKYPGGYISMNVVYGDPFIPQGTRPYDHFELFAAFTTNGASYHAAVISDAYLFSREPVVTEKTATSNGLSMHFDFFNATNDLIDNLGHGNIQFSSNAIGWTVKHKYIFSQKSHMEAKAHANVVLWGTSMYNAAEGAEVNNPLPWLDTGSNLGIYGLGENIKIVFALFHDKAGRLDIDMQGYHIFAMPVAKGHSTGNVFFTRASLNYELPFNKAIGIGTKGTFWGLFGLYDSAPNVNRILVSNSLYVRLVF
jgi:hypothetical protein